MASLQRIEKLKAFLASDPDDPFTRYALALEYHGIGESELAIETLLGLTEGVPPYIPAFQQLGQIYAGLNRLEQAIEMYRRGITAAAGQNDAHAAKEMREELEALEGE